MNSSHQEDFDRARFATVLRNLKRDSIPAFASAVRYSGHHSTGIIDVPTTPRPVTCRPLSHITCGSFNAVFRMLFADGTLWVLKVPANGHRQCWDKPAEEALTSEAFTMRLIRRETTIPVPEVFAFDASIDNELGCPFILMEMIHGKPLQDVWFDQGVSHAVREQIRIRSLRGIAEAMTQLNSLAFSQGGSLLFDAKGEVVGIGSSNVVDLETQYANMRSTGYDNTMAFCQTGPFTDPRSYLLSSLDARGERHERDEVEQGAYKLLQLLIEWSIDTKTEEKPFVLAHPDLDNQNILVNNDGSLAGIIDWDWIAAVPHCIGCQSLPKFLTQDYNPATYAYDVEIGRPFEGHFADSPAKLASYRAIYAQFMESCLLPEDWKTLTKSRRHAAWIQKSRKQTANMTRRSLITTTLHLATQIPSMMQELMMHLFYQIEELTAAEWPEESSTANLGEQEDSEGAGKKGGGTEGSEADDSNVLSEEARTHNAGCEEKLTEIEHLSIDELMEEIEKLTGVSSASNSDSDITPKSVDLAEPSSGEGKTAELGVGIEGLGAKEHMMEAQKLRVARVCGWFEKKLRRGAKPLLKNSDKGDLNASADTLPSSRPIRATRAVFGWTENKLRHVAHCLHCDTDDEKEVTTDLKTELLRDGRIDVLQGLQDKLEHLREKLYCKRKDNCGAPEVSEEKASQRRQVTSVSKELTRDEKRSVCGKFVRMIQDTRLCLTANQRACVARWIIQALQNPEFSDVNSNHTRVHPLGTAERYEKDAHSGGGDSGNDCNSIGNPEAGDHSCTNGIEGNGDREGIAHQDDGEDDPGPKDQAYSEQASENAGTTLDEEDSSEMSQAAIGPKAGVPPQEDMGLFHLLDVCIALAKDNLDERRMQRLRAGFFGLLNQTL